MVGVTHALDFAGVPLFLSELRTPCTEAGRLAFTGAEGCAYIRLHPLEVDHLQDLGLTLDLYALVGVALDRFLAIAFLVTAAVVFWRKSNEWTGFLVSFALATFGPVTTESPLEAMVASQPALELIVAPVSLSAVSALLVIFFLFPNGRFVPRWTVWMAPTAVLSSILFLFVFERVLPDTASFILSATLFFGLFASGIGAQLYRYIKVSGPAERQQTKWVVAGFAGLFFGFFSWVVLTSLYPIEEPGRARLYIQLFVMPFVLVPFVLFPVLFSIAILRYRLWDIDVLINRALVYGTLTVSLGAAYFAAVLLLQTAFRAVTDQGGSVAIVVSTLAIAALFQPMRGASRPRSTSGSTGAGTTPPERWPPSSPPRATRWTWSGCPRRWWLRWRRRCSRPTSRCG